jgi:hypothetical protein
VLEKENRMLLNRTGVKQTGSYLITVLGMLGNKAGYIQILNIEQFQDCKFKQI